MRLFMEESSSGKVTLIRTASTCTYCLCCQLVNFPFYKFYPLNTFCLPIQSGLRCFPDPSPAGSEHSSYSSIRWLLTSSDPGCIIYILRTRSSQTSPEQIWPLHARPCRRCSCHQPAALLTGDTNDQWIRTVTLQSHQSFNCLHGSVHNLLAEYHNRLIKKYHDTASRASLTLHDYIFPVRMWSRGDSSRILIDVCSSR